jgi:hypothetical protein
MIINEKQTKIIRARHERGIEQLKALFRWTPAMVGAIGLHSGRGTPVRLHPNTPPMRDAEHQRKHRLRKISNASRRRNRRGLH